MSAELIRPFESLTRSQVALVGGKNASLGKLITALTAQGISVPPGFATTAHVYWQCVFSNNIQSAMASSIAEWQAGKATLSETGTAVHRLFLCGNLPDESAQAILGAYRELSAKDGVRDFSVAVRSSATAEDLPDASFAGQQESYLNVRGEAEILDACRRCYASLFTDRAISYPQTKGFDHMSVALSVGMQSMLCLDASGAGAMFSIDTETGFDKVVLINAAWGLGENVIQGTVTPDEYQMFKPLLGDGKLIPIMEKWCGEKAMKMIYGRARREGTRNVPTSKAEWTAYMLSDQEILQLSRWACKIERHYGCPMDIE
ncbi:hypothetical protein N8T08_002183 [Aspergillus melleus]|uniref:Uncharacterized protein n=1 Tax=Aspergillus melleus TaxID=138277 RepID=A0ACC3B8Q6_9EURO|nr:hypothetical protein N8T08_002183 [Aspergillus melleus]